MHPTHTFALVKTAIYSGYLYSSLLKAYIIEFTLLVVYNIAPLPLNAIAPRHAPLPYGVSTYIQSLRRVVPTL